MRAVVGMEAWPRHDAKPRRKSPKKHTDPQVLTSRERSPPAFKHSDTLLTVKHGPIRVSGRHSLALLGPRAPGQARRWAPPFDISRKPVDMKPGMLRLTDGGVVCG